jgi:hypothetical protein
MDSLARNSLAPETSVCDCLAGLSPKPATDRLALVPVPRTADAGSHFGEQDLPLGQDALFQVLTHESLRFSPRPAKTNRKDGRMMFVFESNGFRPHRPCAGGNGFGNQR